MSGPSQLAASVESLAQEFDGHEATWEDLDDRKRRPIDSALRGIDAEASECVRTAVLANEHVALRRRFKAFALAHTPPSFYRDHADRVRPIGRHALADGLDSAYAVRSSYVHRLKQLPDVVISERYFAETVNDGQRTLLSFQGLARVARAVILEFVSRQPRIESEPHDYTREHSSMSVGQWAASVWMGNPAAVTPNNGRAWLEGLLEQLAEHMLSPSSTATLNVRESVAAVVKLLPNLEARLQLPYLAAYFILNAVLPPDGRLPDLEELSERYGRKLEVASPESMVLMSILERTPPWSLDDGAAALDKHLSRRSHENGYRFPWIFDVAMSLSLAERYRTSGQTQMARERIALTIESFPGHVELEVLEQSLDPLVPIDWAGIIAPGLRRYEGNAESSAP